MFHLCVFMHLGVEVILVFIYFHILIRKQSIIDKHIGLIVVFISWYIWLNTDKYIYSAYSNRWFESLSCCFIGLLVDWWWFWAFSIATYASFEPFSFDISFRAIWKYLIFAIMLPSWKLKACSNSRWTKVHHGLRDFGILNFWNSTI